jgi:hypothetical protein
MPGRGAEISHPPVHTARGKKDRSDGPSPHNEMQNKGDDREHQQQVNQSGGDVKNSESAKPRDQQNDE